MSGATQRPQSAIQPGRLTWEFEIDLATLSPSEQIFEVGRLESGFCGRTVTIRVGAVDPSSPHTHPIVPEALARAQAGGVDVHLVGTPRAVRQWWTHLKDLATTEPGPQGPRLKAVP